MNPDCTTWNNYASWNDTVKAGLKNFALASMDALIYPFFWTWKVSYILAYHLGGALWPNISILAPVGHFHGWDRSTGCEHQRQLYFFPYHPSGPKNHTYIFYFSSLGHLGSLSVVFAALLAPRGRVKSPGLASCDSVPCITLGYFPTIHRKLGFQSMPDHANVGGSELLPFFRNGIFFIITFHVPHPETMSDHICTPFHVLYYSLRPLTAETTFGHLKIAPDCLVTNPMSYLSCHGSKLKF